MKRKGLWLGGIIMAIVLLTVGNIGFREIFTLPDGFMASESEIASANARKYFGNFVRAQMKSAVSVSTDKPSEGEIVFKLFGFIPIRKMRVVCPSDEDVYLGGVPIGISICSSGAIVVSGEDKPLCEGDMLTEVNGESFSSLDELEEIIGSSESGDFEITYLRAGKQHKACVKGEKDAGQGKYKLGLWVKDDVSGIGTLTYVDKSGDFAALGHAITESDNSVDVASGKVFECELLGVEKGEKNEPGQLRCTFLHSDQPKGEIKRNTKFGIYGSLSDTNGLVDPNLTVKMGGRLSVTPGKAYIVSSVSGLREEYEIEIIKASYQSKADDKSIVFRVTDKRLKELTGGIVQGMSGSPIIQNGKLVGAVTHVFMSDPSKGYGIYSDWMI